jgi:UrcA family protein
MRLLNCLAVAALGLGLSWQALAAPSDNIVIVTQSPWHPEPSARNQVFSLTRQVSYADLDLSTYSGAKQLEERVHAAASTLCNELERRSVLLPDSAERQACVKGAVSDGMEHARAAIVAAEKRARTAGVAVSR